MARPRKSRVTLAPIPGDPGALGPAQPRRRAASIPDPRRDPRTGARLGGEVRVMRRTGAAVLATFPAALQEAASLYAATFEAVEAGGVSEAPEGRVAVAAAAPGSAPCRQFHALAAVERLRRLEAAVGDGAEGFAPHRGQGATVGHLELVRAVAVDGASLRAVLEARGVTRNPARDRRLRAALFHALARVARAGGLLLDETATRP